MKLEKELLEKLPNWWQELDSTFGLIMSNDLDSLFSSLVLTLLFGCKVESFYDFDKLYHNGAINKDKIIGVDLAVEGGLKTFCNHVTKVKWNDKVNPNSVNLNNARGINKGSYFSKFSMSTLLMILSLYEAFDKLHLEGRNSLTEAQLILLMCIDSSFMGWYLKPSYEAHGVYRAWLKRLGIYDVYEPLFNKYSQEDWKKWQMEYSLKSNISVAEGGKLITNINFDVLKKYFPMLEWGIVEKLEFNKCFIMQSQTIYDLDSKHDVRSRVFSFAQTRKNMSKMTVLI